MLAVQLPGMGSSKPPDLEMPFGYSFDPSTSNFPLPSPTAPAPGPSLLDDNESRFLDSFFDGVSSDQFDYNLFQNTQDETEAGFGWNELPPTFMGTTTSFGQQPQMGAQEPPSMDFHAAPPKVQTPISIPPTTAPDVLAAATLLQNGSSYHPQDIYTQPSNGHVRPQSISQFPHTRPYSGNHERTGSNDYMRDSFYPNMGFGNSVESNSMQRNANNKLDIRWGSDASFSPSQGFMAPHPREKVAEVERAQMQSLDHALTLDQGDQTSAEASHTASPISAFSLPRKPDSNSHVDDEAEDSRPLKRMKTKCHEEASEEDENLASQLPGIKKRRAIKKEKDPPADSESGHKQGKSVAASAARKAARENLTELQKRENHIRSEQKRRTLIREGFEDLGELVPGLRGGGFSKSAVLIMTADWLEDLQRGNETLRAQLDQLEGQ
ncbi:hypothetical protein BJ875DRAFT_89194 [Amylocarpus encephaloides]|uniref:BHLH domain-containing protein n=1 Tax=Amylocarpus encephaloides TaxID=45428 RepID=A0A9P7YEI8_9HELO|nr:hypothetical protein BJ875DRAFT_89194 [Amylocarpus encephaloides]